MRRKNFIRLTTAGLIGLTAGFSGCQRTREIKGGIVGASGNYGHWLRDKDFTERVPVNEKKRVVIVGAGVAGLSAAWHLEKKGITDLIVMELEQGAGGNSRNGKNSVSSFPWGAHYVPIPNNDLTAYLDFLQECNVITGYNENGIPVYNESYLCFHPQERLYINGRWQEGLIPSFGLTQKSTDQVARFLEQMDLYRSAKGGDGNFAFAIPVSHSSKDPVYTMLDRFTMKDWMTEKNFTDEYLQRYVNYCTRDDYGTTYDKVSAWAGIHYFASRKGSAANASAGDILTWPEGNGFLVDHLLKKNQDKLRTQLLATGIYEVDSTVVIEYIDITNGKRQAVAAEHCIVATPQFITSRLLNDAKRTGQVNQHYHYMPWMVANLKTSILAERSGMTMSWDNVIHESNSLGYVLANHQLLAQDQKELNLTYYLPLTTEDHKIERKKAQQRSHKEWLQLIIEDLKIVHPDIEEKILQADIMIWGHAMAQPLPGFIHSELPHQLSKSINNKIHFAHTDLAGISIFEEGFYQGLGAAEKVLASLQ
jgi:hypothetical protein